MWQLRQVLLFSKTNTLTTNIDEVVSTKGSLSNQRSKSRFEGSWMVTSKRHTARARVGSVIEINFREQCRIARRQYLRCKRAKFLRWPASGILSVHYRLMPLAVSLASPSWNLKLEFVMQNGISQQKAFFYLTPSMRINTSTLILYWNNIKMEVNNNEYLTFNNNLKTNYSFVILIY